MAELRPLRALHYDRDRVGGLGRVIAPPYDVIDREQRAALAVRSPFNVVHVDLPEAGAGEDPYAAAARVFTAWRAEGAVVRDAGEALWALEQRYTGPDGRDYTRRGLLARVRIEDYGPGRVRAHERTHPGPKEDRLRLTRATRTNLSPIFALFDDPDATARSALAAHVGGEPWSEATDPDGTRHRLWRVDDADAIASAQAALRRTELLIADGHHRYETARVYAGEVGGTGPHSYVLALLVALQDPGLTVFPTHRLLWSVDPPRQEALRDAIGRDWDVEPIDADALEPPPDGRLSVGYLDAHFKRPFRLTLKDPAIAERALPGRSSAYRELDTAVVEALLLRDALGMTEESIAHFEGIDYARSAEEARRLVETGERDVAIFMAPTPVERIRAVAAAGETMPPKSTYFFPKVPTGLVFNPLDDE